MISTTINNMQRQRRQSGRRARGFTQMGRPAVLQEFVNKPSNSMSDSHIEYYDPHKYVEKPTLSAVHNVIKSVKKNRA
jgi:hypothetical protein